jgi:tetratricopeptide (TPR) repeat protein
MELKIKPYAKNQFPIGGFLIKNSSITEWIKEIQMLDFSLNRVEVYPIPDTALNSIWGCLVIPIDKIDVHHIRKNELCQKVTPRFFIAEKAVLFPNYTLSELEKLFPKAIYVMHPDFGFVEFPEPFPLEAHIQEPKIQSRIITKPAKSVFIPKEIKSFQLVPISEEEVLKNLEENIFPKHERLEDIPLSISEKIKLQLYKTLFKKGDNNSMDSIEKKEYWQKIESFFKSISPMGGLITEKLFQDYEDLERRNQKEVDKLMDMLKNHPDEALKYAIPLDESGTSRGEDKSNAPFSLSQRWSDFSLFSGIGSGSGGGIDLGDRFHELQAQYNRMAQAYIAQKEYQKAAFVYMKLLKNFYLAAQALEDGGFYQEAASIYLKNLNNKLKAAECYEKGNMTNKAIDLYKELDKNEKVGDLYLKIGNKKEADIYYGIVAEDYIKNSQYLKASLIYKNKVGNLLLTQALLLKGWDKNQDAYNCLNNYFSNFQDSKDLEKAIRKVYSQHLNNINSPIFLQVLKTEFLKKHGFSEDLKEMAYEIVAQHASSNPNIVSDLKSFNLDDKMLVRDTIVFRSVRG